MEIFELRYFIAAAEHENINKAAVRLAVSPPAVSRAIARLEDELGVQLFERVGRNVSLTAYGKQLQKEASRLVVDLDEIKARFKPSDFQYSLSISGTEFGLSAYLSDTIKKLKASKVTFSIEAKTRESSRAVERAVADGESLLGIISRPPSSEFRSVRLGALRSRVYVGEGHSLFKYAKQGREIPVEKVLGYDFVGFIEPLVFELAPSAASVDGWRDDKFPRKIGLRAGSIETALRSIEAGLFLGYLPEAVAARRSLVSLKIAGCPYRCETEIFLLAGKKTDASWMKFLF